jgi:glycosyltransferase involved in cell wall biosynthesis
MASILIVYQHYLGEDDPGFSRLNEYAVEWVRQGHTITVIAGQVNYLTGEKPERYRRRWVVREVQAGVRVYRVYTAGNYSRSLIGRAVAYFGYAVAAMSVVPFVGRYDVVLASSPPLPVAIPGRAAALWRRVPLVFEVRDLWPDSPVSMGVLAPRGLLTRMLYALERRACGWAARINALTPAFAESITRRALAPAAKLVTISNGVETASFRPDAALRRVWREKLGWAGKFVVLYAGAHGMANSLVQLIEAAKRLRARPDLLVATVGDGMMLPALRAAAAKDGVTNIEFLGAFPKDRMPGVLNAADACLAVLQRNETFKTVYPNKVFEYMACEKPIVLGIEGAARDLLDEAQAGISVPPEDADALAAAMLRLADDPVASGEMGRRGRAFVERRFGRKELSRRMLDMLLETARGAGRVSRPAPVKDNPFVTR